MLLLAGVALLVFALVLHERGSGPAAAQPGTRVTGTTLDEPSADGSTRPTGGSSSPSPGASSSPRASGAGSPASITGRPLSVAVLRDGDVLLAADLDPQQAVDGILTARPGRAGWYAAAGWPKPGALSTNRSIIVGHVRWGGAPDVFARLSDVRTGDTVRVRYSGGGEARFRVTRGPVAVGKTVVTGEADGEYRWVWRSDDPQQVLSLFTCDLDSGLRADGHLKGNWIVQAVRVS